jgi:hypothetical protein
MNVNLKIQISERNGLTLFVYGLYHNIDRR